MKWSIVFMTIAASGLWALIHFFEIFVVLNGETNNNNDRHLISLYEDLDTSNDFTIIHYPLPTKPKDQYTPMVSIRGCNIQKPKNKNAKKVIYGNIRTQLSLNEQRKHCLSALTDTPIRYEIMNEQQPLFVLHATNARVHGNGIVQTANEDLIYKRSCFGSGSIDGYDSTYYGHQYSSLHCTQSVDGLFVASQPWGNETGHFVSNTLPRILPYLDLAQTMPIHLAGRYDTAQSRAWFDYLNLTSIRGDQICATNVYVASPADCRGGAYMSNMHLRAREVAIASTIHTPLVTDEDGKIVLILHRANSEEGREPIRNINRLVLAMQEAGYKNIKVVNDTDTEFWSCVACQLEVYKKTWLFIASPGAGLINLLFMPEGTYVVEIASLFRPEEPYYSEVGQMTYTLGQHYYHYYWRNKTDSTNLDVDFFVSEVEQFAPPVS